MMNRPPVQATLIKALSGFFQASKLSPARIALLSLALIGLLYTILLINVDRQPATLPVDGDAPLTQERDAPTLSTTAEAIADEKLGELFLGEYDRLSGAPDATVAADVETSPPTAEGSWAGTLILSLFIVLGLAYAGIWGLKHYTLRANGAAHNFGGKHLAIQETQILGPNQKLHLVRLGEDLLLIGATDHTITYLARYDADQITDNFDDHLQVALRPQTVAGQPVPLQESLEALRKVQHRGRGEDDA
jgi:flagellar biosynthetic protein FliO